MHYFVGSVVGLVVMNADIYKKDGMTYGLAFADDAHHFSKWFTKVRMPLIFKIVEVRSEGTT